MDVSRTIVECDNSTTEISSNTIRVKDGGVTPAKLSAYNKVESSSSGVIDIDQTSFESLLSVSITASGVRPILICLQPAAGVSSGGHLYELTSADLYFKLTGPASGDIYWRFNVSGGRHVPFIQYIDFPTSGSKTYALYGKVSSGSALFNYYKLIAVEL